MQPTLEVKAGCQSLKPTLEDKAGSQSWRKKLEAKARGKIWREKIMDSANTTSLEKRRNGKYKAAIVHSKQAVEIKNRWRRPTKLREAAHVWRPRKPSSKRKWKPRGKPQ